MGKVIAGDYNGGILFTNSITYSKGIFKKSDVIAINKNTVEEYEVITEESRKSAASGIARGAVGAALLGPVGLLAGLSAKNRRTYTIAIKFKDGKNSLIEVDEKIYKRILKVLF